MSSAMIEDVVKWFGQTRTWTNRGALQYRLYSGTVLPGYGSDGAYRFYWCLGVPKWGASGVIAGAGAGGGLLRDDVTFAWSPMDDRAAETRTALADTGQRVVRDGMGYFWLELSVPAANAAGGAIGYIRGVPRTEKESWGDIWKGFLAVNVSTGIGPRALAAPDARSAYVHPVWTQRYTEYYYARYTYRDPETGRPREGHEWRVLKSFRVEAIAHSTESGVHNMWIHNEKSHPARDTFFFGCVYDNGSHRHITAPNCAGDMYQVSEYIDGGRLQIHAGTHVYNPAVTRQQRVHQPLPGTYIRASSGTACTGLVRAPMDLIHINTADCRPPLDYQYGETNEADGAPYYFPCWVCEDPDEDGETWVYVRLQYQNIPYICGCKKETAWRYGSHGQLQIVLLRDGDSTNRMNLKTEADYQGDGYGIMHDAGGITLRFPVDGTSPIGNHAALIRSNADGYIWVSAPGDRKGATRTTGSDWESKDARPT